MAHFISESTVHEYQYSIEHFPETSSLMASGSGTNYDFSICSRSSHSSLSSLSLKELWTLFPDALHDLAQIRHWQLWRWWRFGFTSQTGINGIWYRRWDIWWEPADNWGGWACLAQQELRITPLYIKLEWLKWLGWLRELIGLIGLIDPIEVIKLLSINSINLQGLLIWC